MPHILESKWVRVDPTLKKVYHWVEYPDPVRRRPGKSLEQHLHDMREALPCFGPITKAWYLLTRVGEGFAPVRFPHVAIRFNRWNLARRWQGPWEAPVSPVSLLSRRFRVWASVELRGAVRVPRSPLSGGDYYQAPRMRIVDLRPDIP